MNYYIKYLRSIHIFFNKLKKLKRLSFKEIMTYEEPERMYLLVYYGFISYVKATYSLADLSINIYNDNTNIYFIGIHSNNIDFLIYLKNIGYDIFIQDPLGGNAYLESALCGNIKIMKYLEQISKDYNLDDFSINYSDHLWFNAYLNAAEYGQVNVIKYLIKQKNAGKINFDINCESDLERNAFLWATYSGKIKTLKYLTSIGVKTNTHDSRRSNAFFLALENKKFRTATYLKKSYNINIYQKLWKGYNIYTVIMAFYFDLNIIKYLENISLDYYTGEKNFIDLMKSYAKIKQCNYFIQKDQRRLIHLNKFGPHKEFNYLKYKLGKYNFYWRFIILFI